MQQDWMLSRPPMLFNEGSAHVWTCQLDVPGVKADEIAAILSPEESQQAARFRFARDALRYRIAHGFMRRVLAAYLGVEPQSLQFAKGAHGKPFLVQPTGQSELRFNLSHSQDQALLALTRDQEVGVDLEAERPLEDIDLIATQFFSPVERATLAGLPPNQKQAAFYRCWSRKEAVIKVMGLGLAMPLNDFDVSLAPDTSAVLLAVRGAMAAQGPWTLYDLPPLAGYANALATAGVLESIQCFAWE